jgi:hypothetical protein
MPIDFAAHALQPATAWCRTWLGPSRPGRVAPRPRRPSGVTAWTWPEPGPASLSADRDASEAGWLASSVALAAGLEVTELHGEAARQAWTGG